MKYGFKILPVKNWAKVKFGNICLIVKLGTGPLLIQLNMNYIHLLAQTVCPCCCLWRSVAFVAIIIIRLVNLWAALFQHQ